MAADRWGRGRGILVGTTAAAAVLLGLVVQPVGGGSALQHRSASPLSLRANPWRLISAGTEQLLLSIGALPAAAARGPAEGQGQIGDEGPAVAPDLTPGPPVAGAGISGGPANVVPNSAGLCPVVLGGNVKVNSDCENAADPLLHGRGQAQNETAIAADPNAPLHVVAAQNDYRRGDGGCGTDVSLDGGHSWASALAPSSFTVPDASTPSGLFPRQYWQAAGDPSVAWDSQGTAYVSCNAFDRGAPTSTAPDQNNTLLVFRSDNLGASWNFASHVLRVDAGATSGPTAGLPLLDKPYMTVDTVSRRFRDRIYVAYTEFKPDGTANIYLQFSRDHAQSWSAPVLVSGHSASLCPLSVGKSGDCDVNQFADPVVAPDGTLYVVFANYNNTVSGNDNRNQILMATSGDGGRSFSAPVKVTDFYDLPDCVTYTGQNAGRACVPVKTGSTAPQRQPSVFRAANYPTAVVDPEDGDRLLVYVGSYINRFSRESNGCVPNGFAGDGNNTFLGVVTPGACSNHILVSRSDDGGRHFSGQATDPRDLPVVGSGGHADQFWQWASSFADGTPVVSFYDRRYGDDEVDGFSDITVVMGDEERRVTSSSMPPPTEFANRYGHGQFLGDYSGLTVAADTVLPFWTDTRDPGVTSCPGDVRRLCALGNDQDVFTSVVARR